MRSKKIPVESAVVLALLAATMLAPPGAFAGTEKNLHSFNSGDGDGSHSSAGLVFDAAGNLYGTAANGGLYSGGIVFELSPDANDGWTEKRLHNFGQGKDDGLYPIAGLTFDALGNLYGTTRNGGSGTCILYGNNPGCGTVFELIPQAGGGWEEKVIHNFGNGTDGAFLNAGVIVDAAGNLYGTTVNGGSTTYGMVFELSPTSSGGWKEKVLHTFAGGNDGIGPYGGLVFDGAGNLYGATAGGGTNACSCGAVYELTPETNGGWSEKVLHSFGYGSDGYNPSASLVFDREGNLYGTTPAGGLYRSWGGTVFELTPTTGGSWIEAVLHNFNNDGAGGYFLYGSLIFDASGNLYGTALAGGDGTCNGNSGEPGCGAVFELVPAGGGNWTETVLREFDGTDGENPQANLIFDAAGNLYGTTYSGGAYGGGIVFEIVP